MARENRFVIMLDEEERRAIESLAVLEKMAPSTLARRRLLFEAELRGIFSHNAVKANRASQVRTDSSAIAA
jgi:hypothetical protein